ncbi:unnamed protein product [Caenorhabditis bovis]|uniref:SAP domain-containing protein n=1 Tax=Caenorhabditis bovis TaxID=2654633 RepID=A0A8S1FDU4_9PELO|nr:unnamed protein product [Caenorhabditis bovis]
MSDQDPLIDGRPLSSLKVAELRDELTKHGLSKLGVKNTLQDRLRDFLVGNGSGTPLTSPKKDDSPVKVNPLVAAYREKQKSLLLSSMAADPRKKRAEEESDEAVSSTKSQSITPKKEAEVEKREETPKVEKKPESQQPKVEEPPKEDVKPVSVSASSESASSSAQSGEQSGSDTPVLAKTPEKVEAAFDEKKNVEVQAHNTTELVTPNKIETEKTKEENENKKQEEIAPPKTVQLEAKEPEVHKEPESETVAQKEVHNDSEQKAKAKGEPETQKDPEVEQEQQKEESIDAKRDGKASGDSRASHHNDGDEDELDYGEEDAREEMMEEPIEDKHEKSKGDSDVRKKEKVRESVKDRRSSSPSSRHPISNIVHIRGLTRPFTEGMLRQKISSHGGEIVDFWMDKVKSHCFVKLIDEESAKNVLKGMHGITWPESNPKKLSVVFDTDENMTRYKEGKGEVKLPQVVTIGTLTSGSRGERLSSSTPGNIRITVDALREISKSDTKERKSGLAGRLSKADGSSKDKERKRTRSETPPFSRGAGFLDEKRGRVEHREERRTVDEEPKYKTPDELFQKTNTKPVLYFKPLTDEEVAAKELKAKTSKASTSERERDRSRRRH